jgi:hypothetical protein
MYLAFKGSFAHPYISLRVVTVFGAILSVLSITVIFPLTCIWFTRGVQFTGFGTIFSLLLPIISFLFIFLEKIRECVWLIYEKVKGRTNHIVSKKDFMGDITL